MLSILIAAMFDRWQDANQRLDQYAILEEVKMSKLPSQPNFVIFLTDDQGYGDLSCMGGTDFKTPRPYRTKPPFPHPKGQSET